MERRGTRLLFDETYREMGMPAPLPMAASRSERVIGVSSLSKTYGVPGIRIGWLVTRDRALALMQYIGVRPRRSRRASCSPRTRTP